MKDREFIYACIIVSALVLLPLIGMAVSTPVGSFVISVIFAWKLAKWGVWKIVDIAKEGNASC